MTEYQTIEHQLVDAKAVVRSATSAERDSLPYFIQKDMAYLAKQRGKELEQLKQEIRYCRRGG